LQSTSSSTPSTLDEGHGSHRMAQDSHRYLGSAKLIAFCTLFSRVTGLARDIIVNRAFGQSWVQDAFNYGFLVPNLFRRLFGEGALSAVFVPVFTEVLDKEGRPAAWSLLGRVAGLMVLVLSGLTILLEIIALTVLHFAADSPMRQLQAGLTAVMLPFMISVCMLALFSSILNCIHHFSVPALLPIVLNMMMIVGVEIIGPLFGSEPQRQVYGVALTVLATSVIQLLIILPVLRRHGVEWRFSFAFRDPDLRRIGRSFLPILLGQGVLLLSVFFDSQICTMLTRGPQMPASFSMFGHEYQYPLRDGALSAINNAQRLYQFPLGVLAISLATAAFPLFSLYGSRKDYVGLRQTLGQSMRVAIFEGLPSGVVLFVLAQPIITLLFQYGRYSPEASARAAYVLKWYALGMPAYCCQHILLRGFYSLKDTLTPMWISCGLVSLNLIVNLTLVWHPSIHEAAFGIGTALTSTIHILISIALLRRRMQGQIGARRILASFAKTLIAGILAGVAALSIGPFAQIGPVLLSRALNVFVPLGAAMVVFLGAAALMRMEELQLLIPARFKSGK
jgi:putative peptidoglycan lipid II flippase